MWTGAPQTARETIEVLRGGRSSSGQPPDHGRRRETCIPNFRRGCLQSHGRRRVDRERPVDGLVVQMADLAGCFGGLIAIVEVADADERHADEQQRERYREGQVPDCVSLTHVSEIMHLPVKARSSMNFNHIADGMNGKRVARPKLHGG